MNADMVAVLKMHAAEDDDGEACLDAERYDDELDWARNANARTAALDDAADSRNGDEFQIPLSGHGELQTDHGDYTFEHDLIMTRQIADDSLIDIANALLAGNATWAAAKRMHSAVTTLASDYV